MQSSMISSSSEEMIPSLLVFTDSAAAKVKELIDEEGNPNLSLRIYITGGGCSGFQYNFTFDDVINQDDTVITKKVASTEEEDDEGGEDGDGTVRLLIDAMSFQYLVGAEIDYKEDLEGAQFIIRNPHAKTTCGCGSSFSA